MLIERNHRSDALLLMACSFAVATSNSVIFAALGDFRNIVCCSWCAGRAVAEGPSCPFDVQAIDDVDTCCKLHDAYVFP